MTRTPPKISDAPGLVFKPRANGWMAVWEARADLRKRGFPLKSFRLCEVKDEVTDAQAAWIRDRCQAYQSEMLVWGRGGLPTTGVYDGTISSLIRCYQTDPDSSFHNLRFRTRENYISLGRRVDVDHGIEYVANVKARNLLRWHEEWSLAGHTAMAHGLMGMLRILFGFGATMLEDEQCDRLCSVMNKMRFKMAPPRKERLTAAQANAVRAKAHELGRDSIALAQALQFELTLRQKDVIGEWVPQTERGTSDLISGRDKWLWGLRWSEIDKNLILRHTTSKRGKDIEVDLKLAPMVIEELGLFDLWALPTSGPMIVSEVTGEPYTTHKFRELWREIADKAGIPKAVFNMDSRAGAISEATDAGADLESVRHAATHSDIRMTQRYSRGGVEKTATVMQLRAAHRNKP